MKIDCKGLAHVEMYLPKRLGEVKMYLPKHLCGGECLYAQALVEGKMWNCPSACGCEDLYAQGVLRRYDSLRCDACMPKSFFVKTRLIHT
jgi:hypothetical protein